MIAAPLTGAQQCAVLMLLLNEDIAATLLRGLAPGEVCDVGDAMLSVAEIEPRAIDGVLKAFRVAHGEVAALGRDDAQLRSVMRHAFGEPRTAALLGRLPPPAGPAPFAALAWVEPATIAAIIAAEHPQVGAVLLAHLTSDVGAAVLALVPDALQAGLLVRLARLGPVSAATIAGLEADIEHALIAAAAAAPAMPRGGTAVAAKLIGGIADPARVIDALRGLDDGLADQIAEQLFVFADLLRIDARGLQAVVREIDTELLVVALKGADTAVRAYILAAMSSRAAAQVEDDLAALGPQKRDEVTAAQARIAGVVRSFAERGELMLPGSGEDYAPGSDAALDAAFARVASVDALRSQPRSAHYCFAAARAALLAA